jgi:hypothetical protein
MVRVYKKNILDVVIKIVACVCGKDGLISKVEEDAIYYGIKQRMPDYPFERFNEVLDTFFDENYQIEDYLEKIIGSELKHFTINLCDVSASADGLDIKENIALHKVKLILGEEL